MQDEAENVLMLGLASGRPEDALLLTVERERQLVMAALQSGRNMIVSRGPASAVEALVEHLTADGISLPGVTGPVEAAGRFSDLWCARTGQGARLHMSMRVYQITEVVVPERPSGVFRQAAASDISLLAEWNEAFNVETRLEATRPGKEVVKGSVGEGRMYVWEDGVPVSMGELDGPDTRWGEDRVRLHTVGVPRPWVRIGLCRGLEPAAPRPGTPFLRAVRRPRQPRLKPDLRAAGLQAGV